MRESDIEDYLVTRLKGLGVAVRKVKWIGRRHAPDRLVMARGGIYVELKAPGEKPRAGQAREHRRMRDAGFDVRVIDSLEAVDAFVTEMKEATCHSSTRTRTRK